MARIFYGNGVQPATRGDVEMLALLQSLPPIAGKWYFVDPTSGSDGASGESVDEKLKSLSSAYTRCVSGAGDGICLLSRGTTAAGTTSYLTQELLWTKHGITVYGACAPVMSFQRSRIANKTVVTTAALTVEAGALKVITRAAGSFITDGWVAGMKFTCAGDQTTTHVVASVTALTLTATTDLVASAGGITSITSYNINLITISGNNNAFYNVGMYNGGTGALEIGGVLVTGLRNYFEKCHFAGMVGATPDAAGYSLRLTAGEENFFESCTIGQDAIDRGNTAMAELYLAGNVARNVFRNCVFLVYAGAGTAVAAIHSNATSGGRATMFDHCIFNASSASITPADVHIVTGTNKNIVIHDSVAYNFSGWGTIAWVHGAASAASGAGALATKE